MGKSQTHLAARMRGGSHREQHGRTNKSPLALPRVLSGTTSLQNNWSIRGTFSIDSNSSDRKTSWCRSKARTISDDHTDSGRVSKVYFNALMRRDALASQPKTLACSAAHVLLQSTETSAQADNVSACTPPADDSRNLLDHFEPQPVATLTYEELLEARKSPLLSESEVPSRYESEEPPVYQSSDSDESEKGSEAGSRGDLLLFRQFPTREAATAYWAALTDGVASAASYPLSGTMQ